MGKDADIGTVNALTFTSWTILDIAWFLLGIPWEPGSPVGVPAS